MLSRRVTNIIRFFLDELLPPVIRDNYYFMYPFFYLAYGGKNIKQTMNFKRNVYSFSDQEYANFYSGLNSISRNRLTDLNQKCIFEINNNIETSDHSLLDVGCSSGYLLTQINKNHPEIALHGCDVIEAKVPDFVSFRSYKGKALPYSDNQFDVVTCTHTLEHIIDPYFFIQELKRVAKKKLLIVVPKQRPFFYTLDEHVNFFFYREQLTSLVNIGDSSCINCDGDWFYVARLDK
jgi:ubiquinone/menaquinone biosynthesis C-methylase UbiE